MKHYTIVITTNDDSVLNYDYNSLLYAQTLYLKWRDNGNVKAIQLFNNWTKSTVCSFGM